MTWILLILVSYLLGAISFSLLIVRAVQGRDIRQMGSGNAGATNVLHTTGLWPALAVLALDVGKGAFVMFVTRWLGAPGAVTGSVALAVVVGHIFPVFHGFRGGKGVATAVGALLALAPLPTALAVLMFLSVVLVTRYVAVGSMVAVSLMPFLAYFCGRLGWTSPTPVWLLVTLAVLALLIVIKHSDNVERLRQGSEWKLGQRRGERAPGLEDEA